VGQVAERGGSTLPAWLTPVTHDRCAGEDRGHVTESRGAGQCPGLLLEGVAGSRQVGRRYELVVQSAAATDDGRCVVADANADEHDAFSVQVVTGTTSSLRVSYDV